MDRVFSLQLFIRVVETGSFSRAAEEFGITQPTVTKALAATEKRLGARLLHRSTRGVTPTEVGQRYYERCLIIARDIDEAENVAALLQSELAYQNHVAASSAYAALPRGAIHADLFRDNVLFASGAETDASSPVLGGFFDFYFAGIDSWLFDIAVCLNDWCIDLSTGIADPERTSRMLQAYGAVRPLTTAERALLPAMARAGALRFWISRLWDLYLPREASMLQPHDPTHFERVLRQRVQAPLVLGGADH